MSLIKAIRAQLGLSVTPANNFTLDASADNGTMKLARGNAGATTQDILTVDALGKIDLLNLARSLSEKGYYTLPGGLIIQWGSTSVNVNVANAYVNKPFSWPITFPNGVFHAFANGQVHSTGYTNIEVNSQTASGATMRVASSASIGSSTYSYFAIGY